MQNKGHKNGSCVASVHVANSAQERACYTRKRNSMETEVWIAEMPSHMIHFNGDKFLSPKLSQRLDFPLRGMT